MFERAWAALRDVAGGISRGSASSCSGDPVAVQFDAERRYRERQTHEAPAEAGAHVGAQVTAEAGHIQSQAFDKAGVHVRTVVLVLAVVLGFTALAAAQRRFLFFDEGRDPTVRNEPYDGRFTFARLKYTTAPGGYWYQGLPSWAHGYPLSEDNLMRIMNEISYLGGRTDAYNVFSLDDPELTKYPICYITEAGWWTMNESEMQAFRAYLLKGGFVIFDDFKVEGDFGPGGGWGPFEANIKRLLPSAKFVPMDPSHPIFHSFFEIDSLANFPQAYNAGAPIFRGIYEDNDPKKRLMVIVNYNTDISQYWEWSGRGLRPFDETNEAYKLGVNYLIYGMTH